MDIFKKWEKLNEDHKLTLLVTLEESKIAAFKMARNLFSNKSEEIISLLARLSKEWDIHKTVRF
jgi:hypothetical protein